MRYEEITKLVAILILLAASGCTGGPATPGPGAAESPQHRARTEVVEDFGRLVPDRPRPWRPRERTVSLERVTTAVPWPRGLAWLDGRLIVLARGRHRNAGGVDHRVVDRTGCLFAVDPTIAERVVPGRLAASARVRNNAQLLAASVDGPFRLPDKSKSPIADTAMDRPYCTLIWDDTSRNFFICGYSGVDLPGRRFRKNATDSIHRFDLRTNRWRPVEMHDPSIVPTDELDYVVSNAYYPHHDPARNPAPHGWLNGPDGGSVVGRHLYCASKDNHLVVRYELDQIRQNPEAGCPPSRPVLGPQVRIHTPAGVREIEALGPSAVEPSEGWLYIGYRTSSLILRFPLRRDGTLVEGAPGELIAVFEPWDPLRKRSANLIDLAFNSKGELFVSCAKEGRIWKVGRPDPKHPFYGNDQTTRPTTALPYLDLRAHTGKRTGCGNILFDDQDRLYICSGNYDTDSRVLAGVVYRAVAQ